MTDKTKPDLIEREAAYTALGNEVYMLPSTKAAVKAMLREIPTIDAAPVVHGRWIDSGEILRHCSACGAYYFPYNYCPDCGARMRGEGHEAD